MDAEWPLRVRELLISTLAGLSPDDAVMRRRLFERAFQAFKDHLNDPAGGYSPPMVELETRLFQHVLRTLERDIRAGVDIHARDYGLKELAEMRERMSLKLIGPAAKNDQNDVGEDVTGVVDSLARLLAEQDHRSSYASGRRTSVLTGIIAGMIVITKVLVAESIMNLAWFALKPVIFFIGMSLLYSINGDKVIFNMTAPAFAATGICFLIIYMETTKRVATAITGYKFMAIPQMSWFAVGVAEGLLFFFVNTFMMIAIMAFLIWMELAPYPREPLLFFALWVALWWVGTLTGLVLAYFYVGWRFFGRIFMVFVRIIAMVSGVAFVSEQLPEDVARVLLCNPLMHLMQALRVAYFDGYDSQVVSLPYFFLSLLFVMPLTFLLACSNRSRVLVP